jgi:hypothetical protein
MFCHCVTLIIPSVTKDGVQLDHQKYVTEALQNLTLMFGGATATGIMQGAYQMQSKEIMIENVVQVTSFTDNVELKALVINYLEILKNTMNQESMAYIVNNEMFFL